MDGGESGGDNDAATKSTLKVCLWCCGQHCELADWCTRALINIQKSIRLSVAHFSHLCDLCAQAMTLAYEGSQHFPYPARLSSTEEKLGCPCISVGVDDASRQGDEPNVAASVGLALKSALRFFQFAEAPPPGTYELGAAFACAEAKRVGLPAEKAVANVSNEAVTRIDKDSASHRNQKGGGRFLSRLFSPARTSKPSGVEQHVVSNSFDCG